MARGGARNRSGPQPQEGSRTSERKGYILTALPAEGFDGEVPEFPLPRIWRWTFIVEGKERLRVTDEGATDSFRDRELDIWAEVWETPQACAWSMEAWRWPTIAEFCRLKAVVELEPDANASLVAQLHRYRDQIGLTPAGMRENGWKVADPVLERADAESSEPEEAGGTVTSIKDRLNRGAS